MATIKEPYYLESLTTSVKTFTLPSIPKTNSFSCTTRKDWKTCNTFKSSRSDSLEPYYKLPTILLNYDNNEFAIIDDDDDGGGGGGGGVVDDDNNEYHSMRINPKPPSCSVNNVRDDYDNKPVNNFFI